MSSIFKNTLTVWHALFLREALDRFFGSRAGWAWLIVEPACHVIFLGTLLSYFRGKIMPDGSDVLLWLCIGLIGFFVFRRTSIQALHAVDCNKAFFAFRQVRPFDVAMARGAVEGFSMFLVAMAIIIPLAFFGKHVVPNDPLRLLVAFGGLWLLGLGYGMITSVIMRLIPDAGHVIQILMLPLYFISCVIVPLSSIPPQFHKYFIYNPITHALELARHAFFPHYGLNFQASLGYVFSWIISFLLIGLILYKLLEYRLLAR